MSRRWEIESRWFSAFLLNPVASFAPLLLEELHISPFEGTGTLLLKFSLSSAFLQFLFFTRSPNPYLPTHNYWQGFSPLDLTFVPVFFCSVGDDFLLNLGLWFFSVAGSD